MSEILWVPALILLLGILVFFHELGHFTMAKLLKVRVDEFAFGFGPKWLVLAKRGDTEYTIHPYPLGGFVKLAGESQTDEQVPNGFMSKPWWQRWIVYFAGPFMSFVLAYLIFSSMGMIVGLPITGTAYNRVDLIMPGSIAEKAGLKVGDRVLRIDDTKITSGNQMVEYVHNSLGKKLTLYIDRNGEKLTIKATPGPGEIGGKKVGLLGFMPTLELKRVGFVESVKYGTAQTVGLGKTIVEVVFSKEVTKSVGGPIAIANETKVSVKRGANGFLQLMAMLSMSLGIFNLLPIPVVDGGQMVLAIAEGIKGGKLSDRTVGIAQMIGLAVIAVIFIAIISLDMSKVFSGKLF